MLSLLILVIVVIFLITKLNEILGMRVGFHLRKEDVYKSFNEDVAERAKVSEVNTALAGVLNSCPQFDSDDFLNKAQKAFEIIFTAYASGDLHTLKSLLAPRIFQAFSMAIADRKARNETLDGTLVRFVHVEIVSSDARDNDLFITVRFVTEQSNVLKNGEGQTIEGNADFVETRTDVWMFSRKKESDNPCWFLYEIKSEEGK